jgi:uncharacterized GH25 family protein
MKKQFTSFIILFVIILGFFNIAYKVLPAAKATPVEGVISQDTLWTLVDSPFVVTNNITVNSGVTLTIEPGVEVRFGGEFSFRVMGKIIAQGTEERMIRFTTNDPTGKNYWQSISIYGMQSSFRHCIIEYGTNATVLQSGSLDLQQVKVQSNLENGVVIKGGTIYANDSEFAFNGESAIQISGGNPVTITNNIIKSNSYGLTLSNLLTGAIQIQQNEISNNTQAGVYLEAFAFTNTQITENNIIANGYGFLVGSNISPSITRNYISRNTVGIYYSGSGIHQVTFNDICENSIGIDLQPGSNIFVNAIHNYWGHRTGPYHEWLSPHGRGNPVGGNEAKLDFIPFLTHPFAYGNTPPTTIVWTDIVTAAVGQTVTFVGTDSQDDGSIARYYFDFNDTANSDWTTLSLYNHTYTATGTFLPSLIVEDDVGWWGMQVPTTVTVVNLTPLQTSVTVSDSTIAYNGETWVTVYVSNAAGGVANADVALFSVGGGTFDNQPGLTDANGYFATKFTAPNATETIEARIIARASISGYADGSGHEYVKILAPLRVEATPATPTVKSEENTKLNVLVADNFDDPVADANVTLSSDYGTITPTTGITDSNGTITVTYQAPMTLDQLNATVTIIASKSEYADGQGQTYITVEPKILSLDVTAEPNAVLSEDSSTITALVTFNSTAVTNATVTVFSDVGGNFSSTLLYTDLTGTARFAFTAPQTVAPEGINTTITVRAFKDGFVDTQSQIVIPVSPKTLEVQIIPHANRTYSGGQLNVTVNVAYGGNPIQDANVTIAAVNGNFAPTVGVTDANGNVTFVLTASDVNQESNATISVIATKEGYLDNTDQIDITIKLRTFSISVTPPTVQSGQTETIMVHVTSSGEDPAPTEAAVVVISFENGQQLTNITDSSGACTFLVKVPETSANTINMTVTVTRIGYEGKQAEVVLNAVSAEGGFPWLIIVIIAIPVIVAVVVVVLIKKKIVVVSAKEEGSE